MSEPNAERAAEENRIPSADQGHTEPYPNVGARFAAYLINVAIAFLITMIPVHLILRTLEATGLWAPPD